MVFDQLVKSQGLSSWKSDDWGQQLVCLQFPIIMHVGDFLVFNHSIFCFCWTAICCLVSADIDECTLFAEEICKKGRCENTLRGYECYCQQGFYYDSSHLECIGKLCGKKLKFFFLFKNNFLGGFAHLMYAKFLPDENECHDESLCTNGRCVNTEGSFFCICDQPWIPDSNSKRCVMPTVTG